MHIGKLIKERRESHGITAKYVSEKSGVHQGALSLIEAGKANPTWDTIQKIVDVFNCDLVIQERERDGQ